MKNLIFKTSVVLGLVTFEMPLTPDDCAYEGGMARAVHQCKLQTVKFSVPAGLTQVLGKRHSERTEPEIQSDAPFLGLRVLVEGCGGCGAAQCPGK